MGHTGLARGCLAHWCYRTRTKPAEVREAPTFIGGRGCHKDKQIIYLKEMTRKYNADY